MLGERAAPVLARVVFAVATPALLLTTVAHADLHLLLSRQAVVTWTSTVLVALVAVLVLRFALRRSAADVTVGTLALVAMSTRATSASRWRSTCSTTRSRSCRPCCSSSSSWRRSRSRCWTGVPPVGDPWLRRTLSNPIIVGTLIGLVLAALPWSLPEVVYEPFRLVGAAAAPLALLTFGMSLAIPRTVDTAAPRPDLAVAVTLRTAVHPLLAWGLGTALGLPPHALLAVVAMAALPTAQNVLVYAMQYRHGEALARDAGLVTTVLCVPVLLVVAATLG